jgi:hypothetical protein
MSIIEQQIKLDFNNNTYIKHNDSSNTIPIFKNGSLTCKQDLLMSSLTLFFRNKVNLEKIMPIINGKSNISLRILDWFVTNYAKKNNVAYDIATEDIVKKFIVHISYKSQLKAYSKKLFDPFCRRERIIFIDHTDNEIITTAGQLNFFRWVIENNILEHISENIDDIETDMNTSIRHLYKKKEMTDIKERRRRKRKELSVSATKSVNKHSVNIIIDFE